MTEYPVLFDDARQRAHPLAGRTEFVVGRNPDADLPVTDASCSRRQFRLAADGGAWHLEPLSESNPTYCNGQRVGGRVELSHGAVIWVGNSRFRFLAGPEAAPPAGGAGTMVVAPPLEAGGADRDRTLVAGGGPGPGDVGGARAAAVVGTVLVGRDPARAQLVLPHAHVSRVHAQVQEAGGRTAVLTDLRSANGTFVNGRRVSAPATLRPGDRVDVGPYSLLFTGAALVPQSRADNVELVGRDLTRTAGATPDGTPRVLLDRVTLVVRPREFVCILGPSGAGKSTLLSALSARTPADGGRVLLNGKDLYAHFDALKQDVTVVPQRVALHEPLTVEQALWYTAKLRLPPDTGDAELAAAVDEVLGTVGLTAHRATRVRDLSGGQQKRAGLATELLGKPSLVFLDEVTSGLDEQTDREMMGLFRKLADGGKTVVCVTHALANVEPTCHLVAVLAEGGRLAFYGPPAEAALYFGVARLGDVYEQLAARPAAEWAERFAASPLYSRYIDARLPADPDADAEPVFAADPPLRDRAALAVRQAGVLVRRHLVVMRQDGRTLALTAAQPLLVAALLVVLFGDLPGVGSGVERARRTAALTFFLGVSCFWFGCNNAAKEFVKERALYRRERDCNLGVGGYYLAKFGVLMDVSWLQAGFVWVVVAVACGPANPFLGTLVLLLALAAAGVALGLAVSAAAGTEDSAVTAIPLLLLPQIILADAVAPLAGLGLALGQAGVTCYWGVRGLNGLLPGPTAAAAGLEQHGAAAAFAVVLIHTLLYVAAAVGLLTLQARRDRRFGRALVDWAKKARSKWDGAVGRGGPSPAGRAVGGEVDRPPAG